MTIRMRLSLLLLMSFSVQTYFGTAAASPVTEHTCALLSDAAVSTVLGVAIGPGQQARSGVCDWLALPIANRAGVALALAFYMPQANILGTSLHVRKGAERASGVARARSH